MAANNVEESVSLTTNQNRNYPPVHVDPPNDRSTHRYQIKGIGAYGVAYINTSSYPPSIIKRYHDSKNILKADEISSTFSEMSGNLKVRGKKEHVKGNNLQNGLQFNHSNISVLRMPYLGENLYNIIHNIVYIRQILSQPDYVTHLLHSIHSLLGYTSNIAANGYCHGDMHMSNIVMDLSTCEMHIIDFDLFEPFAGNTQRIMKGERKNFFHYLIPPEYLFLRIMKSDIVSYEQIDPKKRSNANKSYAALETIKNYIRHIMMIPYEITDTAYIDENNQKNFEYVMKLKDEMENDDIESLISSHFMQYFDNFALGIGLQLLLLEVVNIETPLLEKIKATQELLKRMSSFTIKERPTPKEAYDIMTEIISQRGGRRKTVRRNRHRCKTQKKRR